MARNGQTLKNLILVYKNTTSNEFINYFKPKLQQFAKHNFVVHWENKLLKKCIKSFPANIVVLMVDLVENYSFEVQNEMQNMH
jgi:hypothetical protein